MLPSFDPCPYLQINFRNHELREVFLGALKAYTKAENLIYDSRDSFGFLNMNELRIGDYLQRPTVRLTPGLESGEDIKKYIHFFEGVHRLIEEEILVGNLIINPYGTPLTINDYKKLEEQIKNLPNRL